MKKRAILITLIPLLGLSACIIPEDEDYNKDPKKFLELVHEGRDWECTTSNANYPHVYNDHGDLIKDQLRRITDFERVNKLKGRSCNYFSFRPDCIECSKPTMTVYENGNIEIDIPHWLGRTNKYYYTIDSELGFSIYDGAINAIDYYIESEKEEIQKGRESVQLNNFFQNIDGAVCSGFYYEKTVENDREYEKHYEVRGDRTITEMIYNLSFSRYTEEIISYSRNLFSYSFEIPPLSNKDDYYFNLTESLTLVFLSHEFYDIFNRRYYVSEPYLISASAGKAIKDYVSQHLIIRTEDKK